MAQGEFGRARCYSCNKWFEEDTLAPLRVRAEGGLRWPLRGVCRRCLTDALAKIKGKKWKPVDGQFPVKEKE